MECALDKGQIYAELPPGDSYVSIAALKAAPCVSAVLSFDWENLAQKKGGPVYAMLQTTTGPPRFIIVQTQGVTTTGNDFAQHAALYIPELRLLKDNVESQTVPTKPDKVSARKFFDDFFGGPTRIKHVYKLSARV
jgi:hypothetical protein